MAGYAAMKQQFDRIAAGQVSTVVIDLWNKKGTFTSDVLCVPTRLKWPLATRDRNFSLLHA